MRLTEDQMAQVGKSLVDKGVGTQCKECGSKEAVMVDEVMLYKKSSGGDMPVILTGCANCGFTKTFAANRLVPGLFPDGKMNEF